MNYNFCKSYYQTTNPADLITVSEQELPLALVTDSAVSIRDGTSSQQTANTAAFYTAVQTLDPVAQITTPDTWTTLLNITTGAGRLAWVLSSGHSGVHTPQVRITRDGYAYTFGGSSIAAGERLLVGHGLDAISAISNSIYMDTALSNYDVGFIGRGSDNNYRYRSYIYLLTASVLYAAGYTLLRFASSLKIEVKTNVTPADAAAYCACSVTYDI